jgi:2-polyprenyl-3-methyl-5-hydroxy-6-metoxy-1,4-benzoquinol methylase
MQEFEARGYKYGDAHLSCAHPFLLPAVYEILDNLGQRVDERKLFDLGCGNGSVANAISKRAWNVTGCDPSIEGIQQANASYAGLRLDVGSAYDRLEKKYGQFPVLLSLEVIEHLYAPRKFAETAYNLLQPGGWAIISTPYHGYWKNLAMALCGKMDHHFTALWDHGHIKFWSIPTLTELLIEAGFSDISYIRVGRIPILAKSMIAIARKPILG